jgi:hypothetical protein
MLLMNSPLMILLHYLGEGRSKYYKLVKIVNFPVDGGPLTRATIGVWANPFHEEYGQTDRNRAAPLSRMERYAQELPSYFGLPGHVDNPLEPAAVHRNVELEK